MVVSDWTASMYSYTTQLLIWQSQTRKNKDKIKHYVFFNDGDRKQTLEKVIGSTGGFYATQSNEIMEAIDMMDICKQNGAGGDFPENDIEAILYTLKTFPETKEIVLVADNFSKVRDIELLEKVNVPVHVVITHLNNLDDVNLDYLHIALHTQGTVHIHNSDLNIDSIKELELAVKKRRELSDKEKRKIIRKAKKEIKKKKRKDAFN